MSIRVRALLLCAFLATPLASCRRPIPPAPDREAIVATVQGFHDALVKGDREAALSFLADDAQILESGHRETREQYEHGHLASDIEFAKAIPSTKGALIVRREGNIAWTTSTSRSSGRMHSQDIEAEGAELMILTKEGERWKIRAIHWSSHSHRGGH